MKPVRLATVWLSGCSGCHMSLLNLHGGLLDLLAGADLVYSPLMDCKEYPEGVDIVLVEGAVGTVDNREMALLIRSRTRQVISLGDCACYGNVSALRNPAGREQTLGTVYGRTQPSPAADFLEQQVLPLHQIIAVDAFIPGCPPEPEQIRTALLRLLPPR